MIENGKRQMLNVKRNWFLLFAFCLAVLIQQNSFPQEFTASIDETTVSENDRFQVSFTFSGSTINNLSKFSPPSFENFMILSGPNQSTSIQIINGAQSASLTYSFVIQAKSIGTFSIGSASIEQNGTTYKSDPLKISVVKGTAKSQQKSNNTQVSNEEIAKNLFIRQAMGLNNNHLAP